MFIDAHLGLGYPPSRQNVKEVLKEMDSANVNKAVIWSLPRAGNVKINNDWISRLVKKHPERFIGFASVYPPDLNAAIDELNRAVKVLGLSGVKLHPKLHQYRICDPRVLKIIEQAKDLDIPVLFHVESPALYTWRFRSWENTQKVIDDSEFFAKSSDLEVAIKVYDSTKLWAAHMGGIFSPTIQESRMVFQTAGASSEIIEYAVKRVGSRRVLFGSDYPFYKIGDEIAKVDKANISAFDKRKILGDNCARLLGA